MPSSSKVTVLPSTITSLLSRLSFDWESGKIYRMFKGPDNIDPQEYELPINDVYLEKLFDLNSECPDFFAEDIEHLYFPVAPIPGEEQNSVTICKAGKSTLKLIPLSQAKIRHGEEQINLVFSKDLVLETVTTIDGTVAVYWREARLAALGDSLDLATIRVALGIINRLVTGKSPDGNYVLRTDLLISQRLKARGINVSVHYQEVLPEEEEVHESEEEDGSLTPRKKTILYNVEEDPKFN